MRTTRRFLCSFFTFTIITDQHQAMAGSIPRDHPFLSTCFWRKHTHTHFWFCLYQNLDVQLHWQAARQRAYGLLHHHLVHYIHYPHRTQTLLAVCSCCCCLFVCLYVVAGSSSSSSRNTPSIFDTTNNENDYNSTIYLLAIACLLPLSSHSHSHSHPDTR